MVLGLCSSFAVLPAFSLVKGGGGARRVAGPVRPLGDGADALGADAAAGSGGGAAGVAALLVADATLAAARQPGQAPAGASGALGALAAQGAASPAAAPPPPAPAAAARAPAAPEAVAAPVAPVAPVAPLAPVVKAPPATGPPPAPHAAAAGRTSQGVATWLDIAPGTCANNDAPMGTIITVTSAGGVSVTCKVVSRGPFMAGRIVDLARSTFALLQPVSKGLVQVSVTW